MAKLPDSRPKSLNPSLRLGAFGVVVLAEAALARRFDLVGDITFFGVVLAAACFGVGAIVLAVRTLGAVWRDARPGGLSALFALVVGALAAGPFAAAALAAFAYPPLGELTSDPTVPLPLPSRPRTAVPLGDVPSAEAAALAAEAYPLVRTRRYALTTVELYNAARMSAERLGWELVDMREPSGPGAPGRIDFVARSPVVGVPADVVVAVAPGPAGARIDIRSATRYPGHDLGLNARLVHGFLAAFDEAVRTPESGE